MGYFFDNPLDAVDNCSDCIDNDGDGWVDVQDPDCAGDEGEINATTASTCNDGLDNDEDGLLILKTTIVSMEVQVSLKIAPMALTTMKTVGQTKKTQIAKTVVCLKKTQRLLYLQRRYRQ